MNTMCHRYNIRSSPEQIARALHEELAFQVSLLPKHDVYPLAQVPVIRAAEDGDWELTGMQWGLLPFWWKPKTQQDKPATLQRKTFNARSETIHSKPSFRDAFKKRRCLIPATEFYEGTKGHAAYFRLADSDVMAFAGLWESCNAGSEIVESCTIVTTAANSLVAEFHSRRRMPVILPDDDARRLWMSPDVVERPALEELFVPIDSQRMSHRQVAD